MMSSTKNTLIIEKYKSLTKLLDSDDYVLVHLNPKNKDLIVPDHLAQDPSVTLKLSRYFRGQLEINEDGISAELLFGGSYFTCSIPYDALWGCTSEQGENIIWPESTPEEVLKGILETAAQATGIDSTEYEVDDSKDLPKKGHLRRVK